MKHLTLLALLTACQAAPDNTSAKLPQSPEAPQAPRDATCAPNCPRDLYAAYEAFEDRTLLGALVSTNQSSRGHWAPWALDGLSIAFDGYNSGRVLLSTDRGLENYYFQYYTATPFTAPQFLTYSLNGDAGMRMSPIVWLDDTTARVTVCHIVGNLEQHCNTITQAY